LYGALRLLIVFLKSKARKKLDENFVNLLRYQIKIYSFEKRARTSRWYVSPTYASIATQMPRRILGTRPQVHRHVQHASRKIDGKV